jgi:hypothetical protein
MNARIARAAVILSFNPRRYICYWPASTFSGLIAAEKSKLEAQVAKLKPGPQMDGRLKKIRARDRISHERVAFIARLATPDLVRPPQLAASFVLRGVRALQFCNTCRVPRAGTTVLTPRS